MSSFVIEASGLSKTFGQANALAGVDLRVRAGESVAIMGASGSGKTTLLHCLAGIIRPDAGTVGFASGTGRVEVTSLGERERSRLRREAFGFVFQQGLLIPELTAVENVALALMLNGMPRARAEEYGCGWLAALGSATSADVMRALLDSTTGQGRTLVLVTHDADVASRCSRIIDMRDGRV